MNRIIIITFVILLCIAGSVAILAPLIAEMMGVSQRAAQIGVLVTSSIVGIIFEFSKIDFRSEYKVAHKIAYTPYNKYGVYALVFFATTWVGVFLYILLS